VHDYERSAQIILDVLVPRHQNSEGRRRCGGCLHSIRWCVGQLTSVVARNSAFALRRSVTGPNVHLAQRSPPERRTIWRFIFRCLPDSYVKGVAPMICLRAYSASSSLEQHGEQQPTSSRPLPTSLGPHQFGVPLTKTSAENRGSPRRCSLDVGSG